VSDSIRIVEKMQEVLGLQDDKEDGVGHAGVSYQSGTWMIYRIRQNDVFLSSHKDSPPRPL